MNLNHTGNNHDTVKVNESAISSNIKDSNSNYISGEVKFQNNLKHDSHFYYQRYNGDNTAPTNTSDKVGYYKTHSYNVGLKKSTDSTIGYENTVKLYTHHNDTIAYKNPTFHFILKQNYAKGSSWMQDDQMPGLKITTNKAFSNVTSFKIMNALDTKTHDGWSGSLHMYLYNGHDQIANFVYEISG